MNKQNFTIFPNNYPKLFHSHFAKLLFSKTFQVLENGFSKTSTSTNPEQGPHNDFESWGQAEVKSVYRA